MKALVAIATLILFTAAGVVEAQERRTSRGGRQPVVRETVTIKGDFPATQTIPPIKETDPDVWRTVTFPDHKFSIVLPMRKDDTVEPEEMPNLWSIASETDSATYRVVIRKFKSAHSFESAREMLDDAIATVYDDGDDVNIEPAKMRDTPYGGWPGKEISSKGKGRINIFRIYIIDERMYMVSVSVTDEKSWPNIETWARKFLDSLKVELGVANDET